MVGALIQARMGSTRLPGKVMTNIEGKPLLEHIVERLKRCKTIEKIIIATTTEKEDDTIEEFCKKKAIDFYRGSVDNVLERFINAAEKFGITTILRVCADSPLIDPPSIDNMIKKLKNEGLDLVTINPEVTSLLDGVEVTTLDFLKTIRKKASKQYHFEHVTYLAKEENIGKVCYYEPEDKIKTTDIRITVDTKEDLEFIREVYKRLYKNGFVEIREIDTLPLYIFRINSKIKQKNPVLKSFIMNIVSKKIDDNLKDFIEVLSQSPSLKLNLVETKDKIKEEKGFISVSFEYLN